MKCPFELPVRKSQRPAYHPAYLGNYYFLHKKGEIIAKDLSSDEADYIVQAINSHEKFKTLLRDSTNILTGLMQEHQVLDTDCPTTFSHHTLQKLTRQRKANKQALKESEDK